MKVLILYHPASEHERSVLTFQRDFRVRTGQEAELISLETPSGAEKAEVYGIINYPAVMATTDSGELLKLWEGDKLPLIDEVNGYIVASS